MKKVIKKLEVVRAVGFFAILLVLAFSSSENAVIYGIYRQDKDFQSLKHDVPDPTNELVLHFFYDYKGNGFDRDDALKFIERYWLTLVEWEEFTGPFLDETGATIASGVGLFLVETYSLCVEQTANYINDNFYPQIVAAPNFKGQERRRYTSAESKFIGLVLSTSYHTTVQEMDWSECMSHCLAGENEDLVECAFAAMGACIGTLFNPAACAGAAAVCDLWGAYKIAKCAYSCRKYHH